MAIKQRQLTSGSTPAVESAQRRLELAQALQARAIQGTQLPTGGPVQAAYGGGNALVDLANTLASAWGVKQAEKGLKGEQEAQSQARATALENYLNAGKQDPSIPQWAQRNAPPPMSEDQALVELGKTDPKVQDAITAATIERKMAGNEPYTLGYGQQRRGEDNELLAENARIPGLTGGGGKELAAYDRYVEQEMAAGRQPAELMAWLPTYTDINTKMVPHVVTREGVQTVITPGRAVTGGAAGAVGAGGGAGGGGGPRVQPTGTLAGEVKAQSDIAGGKETATTTAAGETKRMYDAPQARAWLDTAKSKVSLIVDKIRRVENDTALGRATGLMSYFPDLRGGDAARATAAIASIRNQLGINTLQEMRATNPTGAGLGNVTEREMDKMENSVESLATIQHEDDFKAALASIRHQAEGMNMRLEQAYKAQYEGARRLPGQEAAPAAAAGGGWTPEKQKRLEELQRKRTTAGK